IFAQMQYVENRNLTYNAAFYPIKHAVPGHCVLKRFFERKKHSFLSVHLGIEVILKLFSKKGLQDLFKHIGQHSFELSENAQRIIALQEDYINSIDAVISFLQGKNPTLANAIVYDDFLPQAARFSQLDELDWAFGTMGFQDKAKHFATLYLEDL